MTEGPVDSTTTNRLKEGQHAQKALSVVVTALLIGTLFGFVGARISQSPLALKDALRLVDQPLLLSMEALREHSPSAEAARQHASFLRDLRSYLTNVRSRDLEKWIKNLNEVEDRLTSLSDLSEKDPISVSKRDFRKAISEAGFLTLALHSALQSLPISEVGRVNQFAGVEGLKARLDKALRDLDEQITKLGPYVHEGRFTDVDVQQAFSLGESICLLCREVSTLCHLIGSPCDGDDLSGKLSAAQVMIEKVLANQSLPLSKDHRADLDEYISNIKLRKMIVDLVHANGGRIREIMIPNHL